MSKVQVTRRQVAGGGRIRTTLNFLSLITNGDESQNIRLFDGDVVNVQEPKGIAEQLLKAGQTNLTPQFMQVYVSGRANPRCRHIAPGLLTGASIDLAGGTKLLHGKVEFIRFTREAESTVVYPSFNDAPASDYRNPGCWDLFDFVSQLQVQESKC